MSVDNSGYIVIGFEAGEVPFENIPHCETVDNEYDGDWKDWWFDVRKNKPDEFPILNIDWNFGVPNGYEKTELFGFFYGSRSYSFDKLDIEYVRADIASIHDFFYGLFGKNPAVYIGNVQW